MHRTIPSAIHCCSGTLPGHSRQASRAATEADSDDHDVEGSGKSNGEGSGSDAWSVISHPVRSMPPLAEKPDVQSELEPVSKEGSLQQSTLSPDQPSEQARPAAVASTTESSVKHAPAGDAKAEEAASSDSKAKAIAASSGSSQTAGKAARTVKQQVTNDDDDLSDLSGSEADGPLSEEEDWGTWE